MILPKEHLKMNISQFTTQQLLVEKEKYYINSFVPPLNSNKILNFDVKDKID